MMRRDSATSLELLGLAGDDVKTLASGAIGAEQDSPIWTSTGRGSPLPRRNPKGQVDGVPACPESEAASDDPVGSRAASDWSILSQRPI
jgi:hypothetical protein